MNAAHPVVDVLYGSAGLRFVRIDFPGEHLMPPHVHEEAASLNFCLAGTLQEFRDRRTFLHGPASLSLMPAGVFHANRFPAGASAFMVVEDARGHEGQA